MVQLSHPYMTTGKTIALFYECFKPAFSLSSVTLIKRLFSSSLLSAVREVSSVYEYWKNHSFDYTDLCGQINGFIAQSELNKKEDYVASLSLV